MPGQTPTFNVIQGDETIEQLRDEVARMQKTMNHMLRHLSSKNINEIGGYFVNATDILSKDGDVGMSSVDPDDVDPDPVRFFAGGVDKDNAPWRVHNSGRMVATGALIQSSEGYPKVEIDPDGNLITVYLSATRYVQIAPSYSDTSSPTIRFVSGGQSSSIYQDGFDLALASSIALRLKTSDTIYLGDLSTDFVAIFNWNTFLNIATNRTLQNDLDAKATKNVTTSSAGAATLNGGIPIGTTLMTSGGGTVTWNGINLSAHTHMQN